MEPTGGEMDDKRQPLRQLQDNATAKWLQMGYSIYKNIGHVNLSLMYYA